MQKVMIYVLLESQSSHLSANLSFLFSAFGCEKKKSESKGKQIAKPDLETKKGQERKST